MVFEETNFIDRILSTLRGNRNGKSMQIKELRRLILMACQTDETDKVSKKTFKKAAKRLEKDGKLTIDEDGLVKLDKSEMIKKEKKKKKSKDKKSQDKSKQNDQENETGPARKKLKTDDDDNEKNKNGDKEDQMDAKEVTKSCAGNPTGVTRLFVGNLPFTVNEASFREFMSPGEVTHIKWITDKETGKFYGSSFIEMKAPKDAATALSKNGATLIGRAIKINYAPAREGDVWPPVNSIITGGQAGGSGIKSMSEKPEGCMKLFVGNLSFDIDDDAVGKFFENVDAEVKACRWLHHKDTGDFKGW